jgi:hypothetical protein
MSPRLNPSRSTNWSTLDGTWGLADRSFQRADRYRRSSRMTTTDLQRHERFTQPEPGAFGAGAATFRRLERGQRRPKWLGAALFAGLAVIAVGLVVALRLMSGSAAPPPAASNQARPAAQSAPATLAVAPTPPAPSAVAAAPSPTVPVRSTPAAAKSRRGRIAAAKRVRATHAVSRAESASQATPRSPVRSAVDNSPPVNAPTVVIAPPPPASEPSTAPATPPQQG